MQRPIQLLADVHHAGLSDLIVPARMPCRRAVIVTADHEQWRIPVHHRQPFNPAGHRSGFLAQSRPSRRLVHQPKRPRRCAVLPHHLLQPLAGTILVRGLAASKVVKLVAKTAGKPDNDQWTLHIRLTVKRVQRSHPSSRPPRVGERAPALRFVIPAHEHDLARQRVQPPPAIRPRQLPAAGVIQVQEVTDHSQQVGLVPKHGYLQFIVKNPRLVQIGYSQHGDAGHADTLRPVLQPAKAVAAGCLDASMAGTP